MLKPDTIIFHYGEIALKSGNRLFFEKKLAQNLHRLLAGTGVDEPQLRRGKITASVTPELDWDKLVNRLKFVFGLERVLLGVTVKPTLDAIASAAHELVLGAPGDTFKVETSRQDKKFPLTSLEVSREIGGRSAEASGKKAQMKNPQITCRIEIGESEAFVSVTAWTGSGGLPTGTQKEILVMLSGGIDSPVAALRLTRRGATVSGVHFHSYPQTSRASLDKVRDLSAIAGAPQGGMKIYFIPFLEVQKEIVKIAPPELRVILYRRSMFRLSERLAKNIGALALGTGESLGQVASQTLENMAAIGEAVKLPVLRPLLAFSKDETIREAKTFGTFDISIRPHDDCCSLFLPDHPETNARLEYVLRAEAKLESLPKLENEAMNAREEVFVDPIFKNED